MSVMDEMCKVELYCNHAKHNEHAARSHWFTAPRLEYPWARIVDETHWKPVQQIVAHQNGKMERINTGVPHKMLDGVWRIFCHCPICCAAAQLDGPTGNLQDIMPKLLAGALQTLHQNPIPSKPNDVG